jgi:phenylpyruvate tautomerase PptA (4-oxalocrotonate tautomerase family)
MALARIELLAGRTEEDKRGLMAAIRSALSAALRAPEDDPLVRLLEYPREHFSPPYPDRHSDRYTLVEVTMFAGRSMQTKQRLYDAIVSALATYDVPANDAVIVLHEPPMENWAVAGTPASDVDVGFKVDI